MGEEEEEESEYAPRGTENNSLHAKHPLSSHLHISAYLKAFLDLSHHLCRALWPPRAPSGGNQRRLWRNCHGGQLAIWAIDLANFSSILLLKRPFHDITGRTMANPASTPTDAMGSSPADSESREAATRPQNAPLATTGTTASAE